MGSPNSTFQICNGFALFVPSLRLRHRVFYIFVSFFPFSSSLSLSLSQITEFVAQEVKTYRYHYLETFRYFKFCCENSSSRVVTFLRFFFPNGSRICWSWRQFAVKTYFFPSLRKPFYLLLLLRVLFCPYLCGASLTIESTVLIMASSIVNSGALVILDELNPGSPHFKDGASVRVTGKLQGYSVETDLAIIADGNSTLTIDTQHLSLNLRIGSIYQFIGELRIKSDNNEVILKARIGRNVDGMDLRLYQKSLQLLKEFQAEQING